MRFRFLWIGDTKGPLFSKLEGRYIGRLQRLFSAEVMSIPELQKKDQRQRASQMAREARLVEEKLNPRSFLIVLDEKGKEYSSEELAEVLEELMNRGISEITFLVGGYLGTPSAILEKADLRLSLGRMTFPHELARVILVEQIYRCASMIKGLPYHK